MAPQSILSKRGHDEDIPDKRSKKFRKQKHYYSPSASSASEGDADRFAAINLADSDIDVDTASNASSTVPSQQVAFDSDSEGSINPSNTTTSTKTHTHSKRNDPSAFASSISAILSSKLSTHKRPDPVLSRSSTAKEASATIANSKLEARARKKLREDKRQALEKGRVKDVLLGGNAGALHDGGEGEGGISVGELQEQEKKLRKTAQRGVIKLFNAVRAAQVKAEEARSKEGTRGRKEERVGEMSKNGFLEMVAAGGKGEGGVKRLAKEIDEEA